MRWTVAIVGMLVVMLAATQPASAGTNTGPSTAVEVVPGVPFSGEWAGTPRQHISDCCDYWHFYRPAFGLRTGDSVQLALDNSRNPGNHLQICLVSPTDEFGATDVLGRECRENAGADAEAGAMARRTLVYRPAQPNGFLVAEAFDSGEPTGQYTITVERIITRVNIGFVPPARTGRTLRISAALRYGDNTPVTDGIPATLEYRPIDRRAPRRPFRTIARSTSQGSSAAFSARLPGAATPVVQLRACAEQPGGTKPRCTRAYRVKVVLDAARH